MENKKRLIDANAIVEKFSDHKALFLNKMGGFQALLQREKGRVDELDNCIADIINAPTVDAVEVVRCKDCKYFVQGEPYDPCECMKWVAKFAVAYTEPHGYCHKAERKDNG